MELPDDLKITLDKTFNLALGLEEVSSMIVPRRIGDRGRRRLMNINKEIKALSGMMKFKTKKNTEKHFETFDSTNFNSSGIKPEIVLDVPGYQVKRRLSLSIKEINHRVKLSRAGKRSVGVYVNEYNSTTPLSKDLNALNSSTIHYSSSTRHKHIEFNEEKPQPYVSLTNGKIEDPITLPTFQEFLEAKGDEFIARKGKDELLFRIVKATEQINKLEETLNQKLISLKNQEEKKNSYKRSSILTGFKGSYKRNTESTKTDKKTDLRSIMNQYYKMPTYYSSPQSNKGSTPKSPNRRHISLTSEAEEMLDESIRCFYKSKAVENKKLTDILEKLAFDRPYSLNKKFQLIQKDKEKYKNKHHSIEKFNNFREKIEKEKREQQYRTYEQALVYLEILDEFKRKKYEPSETELLILELWKRMVESGWVVTQKDFADIISILNTEELAAKEVQNLLDKFSTICF